MSRGVADRRSGESAFAAAWIVPRVIGARIAPLVVALVLLHGCADPGSARRDTATHASPPQVEVATAAPAVAEPSQQGDVPPTTVAVPSQQPNVPPPAAAPAQPSTPPESPPAAKSSPSPAAQPVIKAAPSTGAQPVARPSVPPAAAQPIARPSAPPAAAPKAPTLDLASLEQRLRATSAIGTLTKLTLKNQVDDLLEQFRNFYQGKLKTDLAQLRRSYDLLVLKFVSLLQDNDKALATAIVASREEIWGILSDPAKFATI